MRTIPEDLKEDGRILLPAAMIPSFRTALAIQRGAERNLMLKTWGGLGDQICAEPTLRFALETFKGCDISLASEHPYLFEHLKFKNVFDIKKDEVPYHEYFCFDTILPPSHLQWEFMSHMVVNCVDFPSLCAFRCQMPISYKPIQLSSREPQEEILQNISQDNAVFVHAGRHWQSKTFPKAWWDEVLFELAKGGAQPVLIGANTDDNRGTVDVDTRDCLDLRNLTSIPETIWLLQKAKVLLTNDSAPLHMAASGDAWIHFVATCKHPDYIMHWRNGQFGYKMKNHGLSGIWDVIDYAPNKSQTVEVENVGDHLEKWLPNPVEFAQWGISSLSS